MQRRCHFAEALLESQRAEILGQANDAKNKLRVTEQNTERRLLESQQALVSIRIHHIFPFPKTYSKGFD